MTAPTRYWEDFSAGQTLALGEWTFTREEIIRFAEQWDPQPFHLDEEAGKATYFGGLVASGWHTGCVFMRLYVDSVLRDSASLGSPGMNGLRWLKPVRPGDTLRGIAHVLEVAPSGRDPGRGTVMMRWQMINQHHEVVMEAEGRGFFGRRTPAQG
jgi:acyl dehydratase